MTFSDDDLKKLKKVIPQNTNWIRMELDQIKALLNRLEAAEQVCKEGHVDWCEMSNNPCVCGYEDWLDSKGNSK